MEDIRAVPLPAPLPQFAQEPVDRAGGEVREKRKARKQEEDRGEESRKTRLDDDLAQEPSVEGGIGGGLLALGDDGGQNAGDGQPREKRDGEESVSSQIG